MLCEKCGKNEANVYMKNVVNGKVTELHLCAACAGESGAFKSASPFSAMGGIFDGMEQAFQGFFPGHAAPRTLSRGTVCPVCGATAQDIARTGRAGCADCYEMFGQVLEPVIRRIHGGAVHTGAIPGSAGAELSRKRRLEKLRGDLQDAIRREAFEEAARLRDEIRTLENGGEAHA